MAASLGQNGSRLPTTGGAVARVAARARGRRMPAMRVTHRSSQLRLLSEPPAVADPSCMIDDRAGGVHQSLERLGTRGAAGAPEATDRVQATAAGCALSVVVSLAEHLGALASGAPCFVCGTAMRGPTGFLDPGETLACPRCGAEIAPLDVIEVAAVGSGSLVATAGT